MLGKGGLDYFVYSGEHDPDAPFLELYGKRVATMARRFGDEEKAQPALRRLLSLTSGPATTNAVDAAGSPEAAQAPKARDMDAIQEHLDDFLDDFQIGEGEDKRRLTDEEYDLAKSVLSALFRDAGFHSLF